MLAKITDRNNFVPFVFILPAVLVMFLGLIIPVLNAFYLSFFDWDMGTPWESANIWGWKTTPA